MPKRSAPHHSREILRLTGRRGISSYAGVLIVLLVVMAFFCLLIDSGIAGMYKYKDKDGVWHFTDTPDEEVFEEAEQYIKDEKAAGRKPAATISAPVGEDLQAHFDKNFPPANKIEEARNATVAIKGRGSGFFISGNGFIVTNRHVIDSSYGQTEDAADKIEDLKKNVETQDKIFDQEERRLRKQKAQLRRQRKSMQQEEYRHWKNKIEQQEEVLRQRRYQFEEQRRQFDEAYEQYEERLLNELSQSGFTVVLADKTELQAEIVIISENKDLALLRLKGYKTPFIPGGNAHGLHHGQPLYAIGSPLGGMDHTVTSGIFSGRSSDLIQTSAQISPGNSGGPLITEGGQVIGVNTLKVVSFGVEGVGFAIPIHDVMTEFGAYIGM